MKIIYGSLKSLEFIVPFQNLSIGSWGEKEYELSGGKFLPIVIMSKM